MIHKTFSPLLLFLMFSVLTSQNSFSQEKSMEFSLNECIDRALRVNLNFKVSQLGLHTEDFNIIQAESQFDPSLSLSMNRNQSETPTFFGYYNVDKITSKSTQANFTLGQNISTGANWGLGFYNTLSESNIETEKNYTSYFGINLNQPLMKGFGKKVARSNIYLARLSRESTAHDIENSAMTLIYNVQNAYWNLVYALESLRIRELSLEQADSLLAYNEKGFEVGILTESDVLEAKSAQLSRQTEVIEQRNSIRALEDNLRHLLNITSDDGWKLRLIPTDRAEVSEIDLDLESSLEKALEFRPDYKIFQKSLEQDELQLDVAKNNMYPDLNLSARYRIDGSGTTLGKDLRDMSEFDAYGWSLGLLFSYPLKNRNARAHYEKMQINVKRTNLILDDLKNQIMIELRNSIRNVEINREKIDVGKLAVEVNELKLRKEEERFRNQLSTSYFVLQFQSDLATARNEYNKTMIDYTLAVAELQKARGTLLKDMNILIIINDE